ncbi:nrag8 protein [Plakobranchus ocellatus]|uniref:Nrag8 protein n=1 Tax=Plakobranchus ocellatus TaxID=259542 RepID=A0AAV4B4X0_9GAST|nr:nrag8 protein [Plakobranchus ocellatus]
MQANVVDRMWVEYDPHVTASECSACEQYEYTGFNKCFLKKPHKENITPPTSSLNYNQTDNAGGQIIKINATTTENNTINTSAQVTASETNVEIEHSIEDLPPHTSFDTTNEQTIIPDPTQNNQSVSHSTTQVTPKRTKPTLIDCASSPIFKQDNLPKPLPHIQTPLTDLEERQHTNLIKRKLAHSNKNIISCKTGGQPLSLIKITNKRKSSKDATSSTKRKRSQQIKTVREAVAGTSKQTIQTQHVHELQRLQNPVRRKIFKEAGLESTVHIDKHKSLAMKVSVGLTYSQQREIRRVLKESGVTMAHEGAERKVMNELVGDDVTVTEMLFSSADDDLVEKPMVRFTNIGEKLTKLLESQRENLTWHDGAIPENEVWKYEI